MNATRIFHLLCNLRNWRWLGNSFISTPPKEKIGPNWKTVRPPGFRWFSSRSLWLPRSQSLWNWHLASQTITASRQLPDFSLNIRARPLSGIGKVFLPLRKISPIIFHVVLSNKSYPVVFFPFWLPTNNLILSVNCFFSREYFFCLFSRN